MAAKIATIVGDVKGLHQRHQPWNTPHLKKSKGFPLKIKSFQVLQHIKNSGEGSIQPPLLFHGGGMNLRVCPRVKRIKLLLHWLHDKQGLGRF